MKMILSKIKEMSIQGFYAVLTFIVQHKITSAAVLGVVAAIVAVCIIVSCIGAPAAEVFLSSNDEAVSSDAVSTITSEIEDVSSEPQETVSSEVSSVESTTTIPSVNAPVVETPATPSTIPAPDLSSYASFNTNIEDNIFLDALVYTGYNLEKHRADGLMWVYILSTQKRGKGWLSKITYHGGPTGYEVNSSGKPDIAYWERTGLVCATYATYVYYNYLPNVAGVDTSMLARPDDPKLANDWYKVGKKWVAQGYSQYVPYTSYIAGNGHTVFSCDYDIPLGSLILLRPKGNKNDYCSHICLYAGYANGYHWVTHVGNENGPEFCAIERMSCGPDPQEMLAVITTPNCLALP